MQLILCILLHRENSTLWDDFHLSISQNELYSARDPTISRLLQYMTTLPISHISKFILPSLFIMALARGV